MRSQSKLALYCASVCVLYSSTAHFCLAGFAQNAPAPYEPLRAVNYINLYDTTKTFWSIGGDRYLGGGAVVQTIPDGKGFGLPIVTDSGERAISLSTIMPAGYWNILFKIQQQPVDLARVAGEDESPANMILHLRIKWPNHLADNSDDISIDLQDDQSNHTEPLTLSSVSNMASSNWQDIDIPFSKLVGDPPDIDLTRLVFIGLAGLHAHTEISNILISQISILPSANPSSVLDDLIKVDQSGYRTADTKSALITYPIGMFPAPPSQFFVQNAATGQTVYTGDLKPTTATSTIGYDESGDTVLNADFDPLSAPGEYQIGAVFPLPQSIGGDAKQVTELSAPFRIGNDAYAKEFRDLLRFYYYQRSGTPIEFGFGEGYARLAVHGDSTAATYAYPPDFGNAPEHAGASRDVKGGWLDAGDKSIQTYSHVIAIWHLLNAYQDFGDKVPKSSLHLPESASGNNDLLTTILYGIAWLNKMADPDGGVHLMVWANDKVEDVDSVTTASAVGAYAKAYSVLKNAPGCEQIASKCLERARVSWSWLEKHPNPSPGADPENPGAMVPLTDDFTRRDSHARAFAAVDLFNATGDESIVQGFTTTFKSQGGDPVTAFGGLKTGYDTDHVIGYLDQDALSFAYWDYMTSTQPQAEKTIQTVIKNAFLHQADIALKYQAQTGYDFAMLFPGHLYWGSNENVLSAEGIVLIHAYEWTGNERYRQAALNNLHFINGRNPVDRDFISGETDYAHGADFYSQFWTDLSHQPPGYAGAFINVDGLVPFIKDPWKRFINFQDASSCEPDVYWNCEVAYLAGYFSTPLH